MAEHKDNQLPGPDGGAGLRWGVEPMCAVLSEHGVPISPSTYYEWITKAPTRRELRDAELVEIITAQREDKKTGSSCRPWGLASCGFDCVARATTWPAAPWSGSCAAKAGRVLATGLGTRPRSPTTPTRGTRIWLTVTSMHRHQIGCGWPTLRMCRRVVRLRRVRHRCLQPPDRGLACGHLDEHRAGPGRRRACFLHPRQEGTISLHGLPFAHNDAGSQGGFNRSSQHRVVNLSVVGRQALPPVFSTRSVLRGRLLSASATASTSRPSYRARSVPFGKYCRSTPLVFSFVPRCHGL